MASEVGRFNVTRGKLDELVAKAKSNGIDVTLPKGQAEVSTPVGKVKLGWEYDSFDGSLVFLCLSKPFLVRISQVETKLKELLG